MQLPTSIVAGDSFELTEPSESGYTAKVILRHITENRIISIAGVDASGEWTFTFLKTDTSEAPTGVYVGSLITETAAIRETTSIGSITLTEPLDRPAKESHAAKMVKLLEAHLEGRISDEEGRGLESYTIGGVPITKLSFSDAKMLLSEYKRDLFSEQSRRRAELGLGTGRRIKTTFTND
jgi:hypothetical protein